MVVLESKQKHVAGMKGRLVEVEKRGDRHIRK